MAPRVIDLSAGPLADWAARCSTMLATAALEATPDNHVLLNETATMIVREIVDLECCAHLMVAQARLAVLLVHMLADEMDVSAGDILARIAWHETVNGSG